MFAVAIFIIASIYDIFYLGWKIHDSGFLSYFGVVLIIMGMVIRIIGERQLKKQFSLFVKIRKDHNLITTGLYKYVRHPLYSAAILAAIGGIIAFNSWLGCIAVVFLMTPALVYRIKIEEEALIKKFGKQYSDYKKKVKMLVPWIY